MNCLVRAFRGRLPEVVQISNLLYRRLAVGNLRPVPEMHRPRRRSAECNSAIQQSLTRRYVSGHSLLDIADKRFAFRNVLNWVCPLVLGLGLPPVRKRQRTAAGQDADARSAEASRRGFGGLLALLLWLSFATGCATPARNPAPHEPHDFPADALVTQRGVLTVRGRQFALNGYLALSEREGKRLIVTQSFGQVLADVLVKADNSVHVMRPSTMFPEKWSRRYVAADLQSLTGEVPEVDCPVRRQSATHFIIERGPYRLELHTVDIKPGPQPAELFDAARAE